VKFTGTKRPRSVTIRPPNMAKYDRDDDSDVVETWLALRGFIKPAAKEQDEEAAALLESA
jgi:hypothetical protein